MVRNNLIFLLLSCLSALGAVSEVPSGAGGTGGGSNYFNVTGLAGTNDSASAIAWTNLLGGNKLLLGGGGDSARWGITAVNTDVSQLLVSFEPTNIFFHYPFNQSAAATFGAAANFNGTADFNASLIVPNGTGNPTGVTNSGSVFWNYSKNYLMVAGANGTFRYVYLPAPASAKTGTNDSANEGFIESFFGTATNATLRGDTYIANSNGNVYASCNQNGWVMFSDPLEFVMEYADDPTDAALRLGSINSGEYLEHYGGFSDHLQYRSATTNFQFFNLVDVAYKDGANLSNVIHTTSNAWTGTFAGDGSGLTNVAASGIVAKGYTNFNGSGTVTIANTNAVAANIIQITYRALDGTLANCGVSTISEGTNFVIISGNAADTNGVYWSILNP